jgi:hypothetical protein
MQLSVFIWICRAAALAAMRPTSLFKLEAEAELVLVRLRWRTHEGEVVLSLPMSLEKEKAKAQFAVHTCGGACEVIPQQRPSIDPRLNPNIR